MMQAIEFWFDFVSPYAYIAAQSVEQLAARYGRTVNWQPVLLGAVFRETGSGP
jgi:2-hydroxychromene-2-carboxylate isomerase